MAAEAFKGLAKGNRPLWRWLRQFDLGLSPVLLSDVGRDPIEAVDSMARLSTVAGDDLDCIRNCDGWRDPRGRAPARARSCDGTGRGVRD